MKNWLEAIRAAARRRTYPRAVDRLRHSLGAGDRVSLVRHTERRREALVLNVRAQAYGPREAFLLTDDHSFSGWVSVEFVFPAEGAPA